VKDALSGAEVAAVSEGFGVVIRVKLAGPVLEGLLVLYPQTGHPFRHLHHPDSLAQGTEHVLRKSELFEVLLQGCPDLRAGADEHAAVVDALQVLEVRQLLGELLDYRLELLLRLQLATMRLDQCYVLVELIRQDGADPSDVFLQVGRFPGSFIRRRIGYIHYLLYASVSWMPIGNDRLARLQTSRRFIIDN